ncbi:MAG: hypothetical protein WA477_02075 [Candidatus Sulfotelmatobacter sp.]
MTDNGNSYRTQLPEPDWHKIAERAAEEKDPKKLAQLIQALCDRLDELQRARAQAQSASQTPSTSKVQSARS